jgi:acyl-CoA reductase-like NAD-dependent aldehyde dehydrogenase
MPSLDVPLRNGAVLALARRSVRARSSCSGSSPAIRARVGTDHRRRGREHPRPPPAFTTDPQDMTMNTHTHYINGKWTPSADESSFDVRNPYDDSLYAQAAAGTATETDLAVTAADSAFPAWADLGPGRKQELFLRAAEIVERQRRFSSRRRALRFASPDSNRTSWSRSCARPQPGYTSTPARVLVPGDSGELSAGVRRPLGVIACFTPWNAANVLVWRPVAEALAAGNTVVVKPSGERAHLGRARRGEGG